MPATSSAAARSLPERALEALRRAGNPFRNHFARNPAERLELFPAPGLGRWARKLGLGGTQAQERTQWLIDTLARPLPMPFQSGTLRRACQEAGLDPDRACALVSAHVDRTEAHNTAGLMRGHIFRGFCRSALLGDEA